MATYLSWPNSATVAGKQFHAPSLRDIPVPKPIWSEKLSKNYIVIKKLVWKEAVLNAFT
jgi:hypothetical protein